MTTKKSIKTAGVSKPVSKPDSKPDKDESDIKLEKIKPVKSKPDKKIKPIVKPIVKPKVVEIKSDIIINKSTFINIPFETSLYPDSLDSNIMSYLYQNAVDDLTNKCFEKYGYILNVIKIVKVLENKISVCDNRVIFQMVMEVENLFPKIDDCYSGEVFMIFNKGIFIKVSKKLKILIPLTNMINYEHNKDSNFFHNKTTDHFIYINDIVTVKILGIQFSKNDFNCFATLL